MLGRLEAQKQLATIQAGNATVERPLKQQDYGRYMRELREAANPDFALEPVSEDVLKAFGVEVVKRS